MRESNVDQPEYEGWGWVSAARALDIFNCTSEMRFSIGCVCSVRFAFFQVRKPTQEAYQNELKIESVERSFILSARYILQLHINICQYYRLRYLQHFSHLG